MPVDNKFRLLKQHPYLQLSLSHVAIGTYPCHAVGYAMAVNRLIIVFDDSGDTRSYIGDTPSGESFLMKPGTFCFVPCHHPSDWAFTTKLQFVSLHFNLELFYGVDVFRNFGRCLYEEAPQLAGEIKTLVHHDEELATLCRLNEIIYRLCVRLLRLDSSINHFDKKWQKYEAIITHIKESGDAATTVEELARMMKVRSNVFSRNFSRDMGISPKEFLMNSLVRKASEMLLIPGAKIKEVAERLNFSSEYYFSTFFKKQIGLSPSDFQRNGGAK